MENKTEKNIPLVGRLYRHWKGDIYKFLHLAVSTNTNEDLVIYKSVNYGTYYARPLTEWNDITVTKENNNGQRDIRRFELYNGGY